LFCLNECGKAFKQKMKKQFGTTVTCIPNEEHSFGKRFASKVKDLAIESGQFTASNASHFHYKKGNLDEEGRLWLEEYVMQVWETQW